MTTPPDAPKPPAELWVVIDDVGQPEYAASYPEAAQEHINDWIENASDSTVKMLGLGKYSSHRYILAPSPDARKCQHGEWKAECLTCLDESVERLDQSAGPPAASPAHPQESHKLAEELERRITAYLVSGGLFNPELANHDAVRNLLIDCRDTLAALRSSPSEQEVRLTKQQAAIVGAYTGIAFGPFSDVHGYVEKLLGRPVWTHEFADKELWKVIREAAHPDMLAIAASWEAKEDGNG